MRTPALHIILPVLICASTLLASAAGAQPTPDVGTVTRGLVTFYGADFKGQRTASGEPFDPEAMTMAHNTLPFGTRVRVTNLRNRKNVVVRVNDRGPSGARRIGDVSLAAARLLGMVRAGIADAKIEVLELAR